MFSVIIPAYNCEKTIERVLDSVKNQTRLDLIEEVIIINDGSKDNTDLVIENYIAHNETLRIVYEKQENHGVSYTRNKGIRMAKSEWIALLDADDLWKKNKIERQYQTIRENPQIVFLGACYPMKILLKKKVGLHKLNAHELCIRNMPGTPSVVFKQETGKELGLFRENMQYSEDINFYQKFLLKDSYYILAEDLVEISVEKKFFAESGLSSDLYQMHLGRNKNTIELYEMGLISGIYMHLMLLMNWMKFVRCSLRKKIDISRAKKGNANRWR
ncbi:MAG: glycosyltransferase family A protein [Lachnospiraceae bacterium]